MDHIAGAILPSGHLMLRYADMLLDGITPERFARKPEGVDTNSPAFCFGHLALYPEHMRALLVERKSALAWGVVPTSAAIREESAESLVARFEKLVDHLAERAGIDRQTIVERAFITPACGTGTMAVDDAERVFRLLGETSRALRAKYGW